MHIHTGRVEAASEEIGFRPEALEELDTFFLALIETNRTV